MITGKDGFLHNQLNLQDSNEFLFLLGCPTFDGEITREQSKQLHKYVNETIQLIDKNLDKYIIFASSTGVNDIDLEHNGSMSYTLAKLFLENYLMTHSDNYSILRIGTIISDDIEIVKKMKPTRVQQRILNKNMKGIPMNDSYLMLDEFIKQTLDIISTRKQGIQYYNLEELSLIDLVRLTK